MGSQFQLYHHQVSSNQKTEDTIIIIIIMYKFMFLLISLTIIHSSTGSPVPQPFFFDQLASFINTKLGLKRQIISAIPTQYWMLSELKGVLSGIFQAIK